MRTLCRLNRLLAPLLLALALSPAAAQTFPSRPVRLVVPQTPGGASDALARIVAQRLQDKWGQPVVVDNRAGAGGNIGMDAVAKSAGDGHTLLMSYVGSHAINPSIYKKLPFDPENDFVAVATIANVPFVAVVPPTLPAGSMKELAAYAAGREVTFGSAGNGSVNHLLGEMFAGAAQARMKHIPYKGAAPALNDLLAGQIQLVFTSLPSVAGHIKAGTLRGLAVTSARRSPAFRDIPTMAEAGFPALQINAWFGIFAPAGTPAATVRQINADINAVLAEKDVAERIAAQGAEVSTGTPQELAAQLRGDIQRWAAVVKQSGASVE